MKVLVVNGSPKGENSVTLQTVYYLQIKYKESAEFLYLHAGQRIHSLEKDFQAAEELLKGADLILFSYPVYTFLVPAQLHRFIELIKEHGIDMRGKYATQISTSKHFYDITAHQFIQDNCDDLGMKYLRGLSADMEDLLSSRGRKEAEDFFAYILWNMKEGFSEPRRYVPEHSQKETIIEEHLSQESVGKPEGSASDKRIIIVTDMEENAGTRLSCLISRFQKAVSASCEVVNLRAFPFSGGCLGCFHCASNGVCVYKDGFDTYLRENIQKGDAIIYAYTIKDHSMGSRFKMYDDRQFCNGHRTVTMGKPVGYLVDGNLESEENLRTVMEARAQVGGNYLAGIACSAKEAEQLARRLEYCLSNDYRQPKNFYGVGGLKIFRDLIYQMQGLMREDHRFYKQHGFYDFPQKKKGMIAAMYLVGAMMSNKKLQKKISGKMTEGMLMPYQKVLKQAEEEATKAGKKNE